MRIAVMMLPMKIPVAIGWRCRECGGEAEMVVDEVFEDDGDVVRHLFCIRCFDKWKKLIGGLPKGEKYKGVS